MYGAARRDIACRGSTRTGCLEVTLEPLLDLAARRRTHLLRDRLAVLEQQHRRNAANAVAPGRLRILVDVELGDRHLLAQITGDLFERGSDHAAWTAPFRPEVDEDGARSAQNIVLEALVGDGLRSHFNLSP